MHYYTISITPNVYYIATVQPLITLRMIILKGIFT